MGRDWGVERLGRGGICEGGGVGEGTGRERGGIEKGSRGMSR